MANLLVVVPPVKATHEVNFDALQGVKLDWMGEPIGRIWVIIENLGLMEYPY